MNKCSIIFLTTCVIAILNTGCGTVAPDDVHHAVAPKHTADEFTGTLHDELTTIPFGGEMDRNREFFKLIHETSKDGVTTDRLCANYKGFGQWLFIRRGASLIFLIDGKSEKLSSADGSQNHDPVGNRERAYYPLTKDLCQQIAQAQVVKVRLIGEDRTVDKKMDKRDQKIFGDFATQYFRQADLFQSNV